MSIQDETQKVRTTSLGWMIQRIARHLDREMEARLSEYGMTLQHFAVMMTVLETEGLSQSEIGERFGMPAYAISRAIDYLEESGFLERRPHPTSRRAHIIQTTEAGRRLAPALFSIVQEVNDGLAEPLTQGERGVFSALLARVLLPGGAATAPPDKR